MNLRDLEYVVAVADKRHFGLAADVCNVSQPALSAQIKKLEEELGMRLFDRTTRDVIPTAAAAFVIENARLILEKAAEIKKHAHLLKNGAQPKIINLGIIPTIAPYFLTEFLDRVATACRGVDIRWQIHEEKTGTLLQKLAEGRIDAALLTLPVPAPQHAAKVLFDEPFYVAVPEGHDLAREKDVRLQDLQGTDWLLLEDGHCMNAPMVDICNKAKNAVNQHSFRAASLETLRHMVASRTGITLIPHMARRKNDGIVYLPFRDAGRYKRSIGMIWRKDSLFVPEINKITSTWPK